MKHTKHADAPDLLLDIIAGVGGILVKAKESESSKYWSRALQVMKYAYGYMNDLRWVIRENERLTAENEFLKHWSRELSDQLNKYEVITGEKLKGTFDETVAKVDKYLNERES